MKTLEIKFTEAQAVYIRNQVESNCDALKNHIASAVERGSDQYGTTGQTGLEYAQSIVPKLRAAQAVFSTINGALLRADGTIKD
jgi:hypothetical protein